jgi:hypothetical protein
MASIDESFVDVTEAAEHLLYSQGAPWQDLPANIHQWHIAHQVLPLLVTDSVLHTVAPQNIELLDLI